MSIEQNETRPNLESTTNERDERRLMEFLDKALERHKDLFKVTDDRIRNLDVQVAALGTAAIALLALVATMRDEAFTSLHPLTILVAVATLVTVLLATVARSTWEPRQLPREDLIARAERQATRYTRCSGDLGEGASGVDLGAIGREIIDIDWLIDIRTTEAADAMDVRLRDAAELRLLLRCAWKQREASASTRYSKKKQWAAAAAVGFFAESTLAVGLLGTS